MAGRKAELLCVVSSDSLCSRTGRGCCMCYIASALPTRRTVVSGSAWRVSSVFCGCVPLRVTRQEQADPGLSMTWQSYKTVIHQKGVPVGAGCKLVVSIGQQEGIWSYALYGASTEIPTNLNCYAWLTTLGPVAAAPLAPEETARTPPTLAQQPPPPSCRPQRARKTGISRPGS